MGESQSKLSGIHINADLQRLCGGCKEIELRIEAGRERERRGLAGFIFRPFMIHRNFDELSKCAQQCVGCRIFRQALLLRELGEAVIHNEGGAEKQVQVSIRRSADMPNVKEDLMLEISIGPPDLRQSASVACLKSTKIDPLALSPDPNHGTVFQQARQWLDECDTTHVDCANLRWSSRNPTRLVRILSDSEVQLVQTLPEAPVIRYAALSYCWGKAGDGHIASGKTSRENIHQRVWPFACTELPPTVQDAIIFVRRLGIQYIWIDTLCIVQNDAQDWEYEASNMHEVYGNAFITLCASSNSTATERLFKRRDAWLYPTERCRLAGQWLANFDVSLDETRAQSPLAHRAWTLQEERLSPRTLYWSAQRMYWSCSIAQHQELSTIRGEALETRRPSFYNQTLSSKSEMSSAQGFLKLCRTGVKDNLHEAWLDLVRSYLQRDLTFKGDRFAAVSGLASRYCQAQQGDHYLAGLWKESFAEDLVWSVIRALEQTEKQELEKLAPSWSWASLPLCTDAILKLSFSKAPGFNYISCSPPVDISEPHDEATNWSSSSKTVQKGAAVKQVTVQGRLRRLAHPASQMKIYADLSRVVNGKEHFLFSDDPEQPVHSIDMTRGRVLAYENRKQEVIGQLDYLHDAQRFADRELEIQCLEVGESAMLLLEFDGSGGSYRRVGVSHDYWQGFFSRVEIIELILA